MYITKVELRNFKRFTDLTIDGIPADAKLVLLIGSNGSGKSSVFDAFEIDNSQKRIPPLSTNETALRRANNNQDRNVVNQRLTQHRKSSLISDTPNVKITTSLRPKYVDGTFVDEVPQPNYPRDLEDTSQIPRYYGRTSFRQLPRLTRTQSGGALNIIEHDSDRPHFFIDRDDRFENDIEHITQRVLKEIFRSEVSSKQIKAAYIDPINKALDNIFGLHETTKLSLVEVIPPLEGKVAQITFRKGQSEIHYNFLSAGEKEVINILLNLLVRRDQFTDTVYFFDEIDLHLNTRLQFNLLKEITENWIPENCQFWTASHSLGFIDYARQYEKGVIIDFDDLDFDQPQTLFPQPKERLDVYDIAVPKEMLFEIMKDKKIVLCENQNDEYYNLLALPNTLFVGMKDARSLFLQIKNDARYFALRDRDFLSDTEIERIENQYANYRILRYYDFENYLYHPDNIAELNHPDFDREAYVGEIVRQKKERFNALLLNLKSSRSYEELKTGDVMDKTPDGIVEDLQSDEFERFYSYFDMKDAFNKSFLTRLNLDKKRLVQTAWFRQQIESVLNR